MEIKNRIIRTWTYLLIARNVAWQKLSTHKNCYLNQLKLRCMLRVKTFIVILSKEIDKNKYIVVSIN